jgi:hypothetical protein
VGRKSSEQVRTPLPRISALTFMPFVHGVGVDMLRALGPARELDKGKGEATGQDIFLLHINRGLLSLVPMSYSTALHRPSPVRTVLKSFLLFLDRAPQSWDLGFEGCEYEVTDITFLNRLHDRKGKSLPRGSTHDHDGDLLDERHPLLCVKRAPVGKFECVLDMR